MIANSATDTHLIDSMPSSAGSRGMLAARQTGGSARHEHSTGLAEPALDLIEEHLTDINLESEYRSAIHAGKLLNNWNVHEDFKLDSSGHGVVLKVQSFDAGGAEFTCKLMNLEIGREGGEQQHWSCLRCINRACHSLRLKNAH